MIELDSAYVQEEIIDWSKEHLAKHKYPRVIRFIKQLPLGSSQKVLKRELRLTYAERGV